jgi:hypothetical protein
MSINACTLNRATVDTFCSPRRAIVFAKLVDELHPVYPPQATASKTHLGYAPYRDEEDDRPTLKFEQPIITVHVDILGFSGSDTQDISGAQLDFVTVTDFEHVGAIDVSITDITFD